MRGNVRNFLLTLGLIAVLGILATACGGDDEEAAAPAATGASPASSLKLGAAGIPSNPRPVRGLEQWLVLDDGLAVWKQRPASEDRTGITKDSIKLGQSALITGAAADIEACQGPIGQAIVKRINEAGGIHGRKIEWIKRDNQLNPAVHVQIIKELVEKDQVFALVDQMISTGHEAVRGYMHTAKVPELFQNAQVLSDLEPPWPYLAQSMSFVLESSSAAADYVKQAFPDAKVAVITSDTAGYRGMSDTFKARAGKIGLNVVADYLVPVTQVDLSSQAVQIARSGATFIYDAAISPQARPNFYRSLQDVAGVKIPTLGGAPPSADLGKLYDGSASMASTLTPQTSPDLPLWAALEKLASEENARYCATMVGGKWQIMELLIRLLEAAGPDLTREGLLEAQQYAFDGKWKCSICLAPVYLNYADGYVNEVYRATRWDASQNKLVFAGEPISYETSLGEGLRGTDARFPCDVPAEVKGLNLPNYPSTLCPWKR